MQSKIFKMAVLIAAFFVSAVQAAPVPDFLEGKTTTAEMRYVVTKDAMQVCQENEPDNLGEGETWQCTPNFSNATGCRVTYGACRGTNYNYKPEKEVQQECEPDQAKFGTECAIKAVIMENDSCGNNSPLPNALPNFDNNGLGCAIKSDGSRCLMNSDGFEVSEEQLQDSITGETKSYSIIDCYETAIDSTPPWDIAPVNELPSDLQNDDDLIDVNGCKDFYGQLVCKAQESQMCSNGQCVSGCGTINLGAGDEFVCFTNDTDGDSIPDLNDPDIDGDGILNHNDADADGNGQDDAYTQTKNSTIYDFSQNINSNSNGSGSGDVTVNVDNTDLLNSAALTNEKLDTLTNEAALSNALLSSIDSGVNDVKTGVNIVGNKVDTLNATNENGFQSVVDKLDELKQEEEVLTEGTVDFTPTENMTGFYTSSYPNGLSGVWEEKKLVLESTPIFAFNDQLKNISVSGTAPSYSMCFDMGIVDFGCQDIPIDTQIFAFIKIIMLVSAGFAAYYIVTLGK